MSLKGHRKVESTVETVSRFIPETFMSATLKHLDSTSEKTQIPIT